MPGASFFENEEGAKWLSQLVIATILIFGITCGIGAERLSLFFEIIGIVAFVGLSKSSITRIENDIEDKLHDYKNKYDNKVMEKASELDVTPAFDETFFERLMVMVSMDLPTGFIFTEKAEDNRRHETWERVTKPFLSKFKSIRCVLSDKAKALLKLANDTYQVIRIPDLFHMLNDVSSVMRYAFERKRKSIYKIIKVCDGNIVKGVDTVKSSVNKSACIAQLSYILGRQKRYQKHHLRLTVLAHPFKVINSQPQTSQQVKDSMMHSIDTIITLKDELKISDKKNKLLRTKKQIPDFSCLVEQWWGWVESSLKGAEINDKKKDWLKKHFLPCYYWKLKLSQTRSKRAKLYYKKTLTHVERLLFAHTLTKDILDCEEEKRLWENWAKQMCLLFSRSTSAVEGRNAWISQIHFNGRGLTENRLLSQTAIKNYFLKREDGTTACERLTGIIPENLMNYLMENIDPLPEPRKWKKHSSPQTREPCGVPA